MNTTVNTEPTSRRAKTQNRQESEGKHITTKKAWENIETAKKAQESAHAKCRIICNRPCLISVRLSPRLSRSIDFGDVSETNRQDHVTWNDMITAKGLRTTGKNRPRKRGKINIISEMSPYHSRLSLWLLFNFRNFKPWSKNGQQIYTACNPSSVLYRWGNTAFIDRLIKRLSTDKRLTLCFAL